MTDSEKLDAALRDAGEPDLVLRLSPRVAGLVSALCAVTYSQIIKAKPGCEEEHDEQVRRMRAMGVRRLAHASEDKAGLDALWAVPDVLNEVEEELSRRGWCQRLVGLDE